jgi:predicted lipid-binding transport protein (Tim44 family)
MRRRAFFRGAFVVASALVATVATEAKGRPGGGQGYSGGSGRSGGSGSSGGSGRSGSSGGSSSPGGGSRGGSGSSSSPGSGSSSYDHEHDDDDGLGRVIGQLIVALVILGIKNPVIGLPMLGALILAIALRFLWAPVADWMGGHIDRYVMKEDEPAEPSEGAVDASARAAAAATAEARARKRSLAIETIRRLDGDFSLVVFEDFLQMLYARVHDARGADQLDEVAPYVTEEARRKLRDRAACKRIEAVVIGSMSLSEFRGLEPGSQRLEVDVRFEANLTEIDGGGQRRGVYVVETWTMARGIGLASRSPERAQTFDCPACGAPLESRDVNTNRCLSCGQVRTPGEADWALVGVELEEETVVPPALTTHVEERGTDEPTIVDRNAKKRLGALETREAGFSWDAFLERVHDAYAELNAGWSERNLGRARPYVSDAFYRSQLYWVAAYQHAKLRNVMEEARIEKVELADVASDRWYDAITIRIFAEGLDYTIREGTDEVVSGRRSKPRRYSEYWTFVRSARAKPSSREKTQCPDCGAPVEIEMTGQCRYCRAHVTSGEFDWVLSRIEQDESYGR